MSQLKTLSCGSVESAVPPDERTIKQLGQAVSASGLVGKLVRGLKLLSFEARKDAVAFFQSVIASEEAKGKVVDTILFQDRGMMQVLVEQYQDPDICQNVGMVLRACISNVELANVLLSMETITCLSCYVLDEKSSLLLSTDAFKTLSLLVSPEHGRDFVKENFIDFFNTMHRMIGEGNFLVKQECLKLLSTRLLCTDWRGIMKQYITNADYLKEVMILLRDKKRALRRDAFQLFMLFAANPDKPKSVHTILVRNRERLVEFVESNMDDWMSSDNPESSAADQDRREVEFVLKRIRELPDEWEQRQAAA